MYICLTCDVLMYAAAAFMTLCRNVAGRLTTACPCTACDQFVSSFDEHIKYLYVSVSPNSNF